MFVELVPLLTQRTLLITVTCLDEKLKVNVIPAKPKEEEEPALTAPLSYTGTPGQRTGQYKTFCDTPKNHHLGKSPKHLASRRTRVLLAG